MANQDSFISEVTEEVRRERLFKLARRYGWIAILLVVLIVGGAAIWEWQKAKARAEAEAAGDAILAALELETPEERADALSALSAEGDGAKAGVLALLASGAEAEAGTPSDAMAALDAVVADEGVPQLYRDLALLKSVLLGAADTSPEDRIAMLEPLTRPGNPFRLLALEQRALAVVEQGNTDEALDIMTGILADADVTQDLRRRVSQLIVALGGTVPQQG